MTDRLYPICEEFSTLIFYQSLYATQPVLVVGHLRFLTTHVFAQW